MRRIPKICTRVTLIVISLFPVPGQAQDLPWSIQQALGTPGWLTIQGSYRIRYEYLDNSFRIIGPANDELLVSRLRLHVRARGQRFYGGFEFEDARGWLSSNRTPVGTDDINVLEPLRVYAGYRTRNFEIQIGRMTMDAGSRRLIARNRTRNTTNAFTGVDATWTIPERFALRAFLTMPVARLPNNLERERLLDNEFEIDQEHKERLFWGLHLSRLRFENGLDIDLYLYGIKEEDRPSLPTRNRDFVTAGARARKATNTWSFEVESAVQYGTNRASILPVDVTDLDHRAWFMHLEYTRPLAGKWSPRLILRFDYASGDEDPDDGEFNRFDTLFGARRWEFGPTGIYGALARSNILSPGIALRASPTRRTDVRVDYRPAWLASDRDFLTTAGLRDRDGNSGSFIGHQVDLRWRWMQGLGNFSFDITAAYLWKGEFLENAPGAPLTGNTFYWYMAASIAF